MLKLLYFALNIISGFIELGPVFLGLNNNYPVFIILIFPLIYQITSLIAFYWDVSLRLLLISILLSLILIFIWKNLLLIQLLVYMVISFFCQVFRKRLKNIAKTNTFNKRITRIIGFVIAPFYSIESIFIILLIYICVFFCFYSIRAQINSTNLIKPSFSFINLTMLIHQSHYFSYAYLIPIIFMQFHGINKNFGGLVFIIGWISYIFSKRLFSRFNNYSTFIFGHILITISLLFIFLSIHSILFLCIAWFLTGLGGGTVYCLREINKKTENNNDLDFWENLGHICGVSICILFIAIFNSVKFAILQSAIIASITCIIFLFPNF